MSNIISKFFGNFFNNQYYAHYDEIGSREAKYIDFVNLHNVYHTIPHVKMVINKRAEMLSNGVFKVMRNGKEMENHRALELLKNPNILQSQKEFLMCLSVNHDVYGNAFVYKNETVRKTVKSMWVLPSGEVKCHVTGKIFKQIDLEGIIEKYELNDGEILTNNEVIKFKDSDNKLILAESKLSTLKQQISNIKYAYDSRNILLNERGAIGILSVKSGMGKDGIKLNSMSPAQKEAAEKKLTKDYGIQKGQKRINVTSLDVDWKPMAFPTKDLLLFEEIEDDFKVIADSYGLNKHIFSEDATYENQNAALKRVYQDTIIPYADSISSRLGKGLNLLPSEQLIISFDHLPIMQEDEKHKAETYKIMIEALSSAVQSGLMTQQEAMDKLNMK